jgi:putative tryptophan/tyrosine transport system substrate-binding protein
LRGDLSNTLPDSIWSRTVPISSGNLCDPPDRGCRTNTITSKKDFSSKPERASERFGKRLQILKEVIGQVSRGGILWDLQLEYFRRAWAPALGEAARQLSIEIASSFLVENESALQRAFAAMVQEAVGAVLISAGSTSYNSRALVADLARRNGLPTIAAFREFPQAGILMSYGPDLLDL